MDDRVESYKILQQNDKLELETDVNNQIQNGFEPFGNLQIIPCEVGMIFIQAMIKKEKFKTKTF